MPMKIRTKIIGLVAGVLFGACACCGAFAVNQYMNDSVKKLAETEMGKLKLAERAFSQVGTRLPGTLICDTSLPVVIRRDMLF